MPVISVTTNAKGLDTKELKVELAKWWSEICGVGVGYQMVHIKQGEVR